MGIFNLEFQYILNKYIVSIVQAFIVVNVGV